MSAHQLLSEGPPILWGLAGAMDVGQSTREAVLEQAARQIQNLSWPAERKELVLACLAVHSYHAGLSKRTIHRLLKGSPMEQKVFQEIFQDSFQSILRKTEAEGEAKGKQEGALAATQAMLLEIVQDLLGHIPPEAQAQIEAAHDTAALKACVRPLLKATSESEALAALAPIAVPKAKPARKNGERKPRSSR